MLLALDTSLDATSAAVGWPDGTCRAARFEIGAARQAEWLMPMIETVLDEAGIAPAALTKIGVTVGPGSFTGLRIALSAARAMAAALGIAVVGVTTTRLLHAASRTTSRVLVALDARHGRLYVELFDEAGRSLAGPGVAQGAAQLGALIGAGGAGPARTPLVIGSGAALACEMLASEGLAATCEDTARMPDAKDLLPLMVRLEGRPGDMPQALYLRPPDVATLEARGS